MELTRLARASVYLHAQIAKFMCVIFSCQIRVLKSLLLLLYVCIGNENPRYVRVVRINDGTAITFRGCSRQEATTDGR